MASLDNQAIKDSYEQLLHVDTDGGGTAATPVPVKDGDNGTTFALQLSTKSIVVDNPTASSSTEGGKLILQCDDGAVMASGHRLGVIEFGGAEDTSSTITTGARIEAVTDATWSASENGAYLRFITTDGNASQSEHLRITADGRIGIGKTAPRGALDIVGTATDKYSTLYMGDDGSDQQGSGLIYAGNDLILGADGDVMIVADGNDDDGVGGSNQDVIFGYGSDTNLGASGNFPYGGSIPRVETMRITSSNGNVGIGTSGPAHELHVASADAVTSIAIDNTATDGDAALTFKFSNTAIFTMGVDDGDADKFKIGTTAIGTNTRLTIDSSGNVGIGTASPAALLDVRGTVNVGVNDAGHDVQFFGNTSGKYWLWDTSADGSVQVGNSQLTGTLTVGVDGTGHDVKFFGTTSGSFMGWDESLDALILTDSSPIRIGDGGDMTIYHNGSHSFITNSTGAMKIATETSGIAVSIGHTTSETTVNDNLTVTGTTDLNDTITIGDAKNIVLNTSTGTKIGTATNQKLGFYNKTPVDQPATVSDPSGGSTTDAEARTAINAIIDRLQELGLIA
jgi:hypothetical protein